MIRRRCIATYPSCGTPLREVAQAFMMNVTSSGAMVSTSREAGEIGKHDRHTRGPRELGARPPFSRRSGGKLGPIVGARSASSKLPEARALPAREPIALAASPGTGERPASRQREDGALGGASRDSPGGRAAIRTPRRAGLAARRKGRRHSRRGIGLQVRPSCDNRRNSMSSVSDHSAPYDMDGGRVGARYNLDEATRIDIQAEAGPNGTFRGPQLHSAVPRRTTPPCPILLRRWLRVREPGCVFCTLHINDFTGSLTYGVSRPTYSKTALLRNQARRYK